MANVSVIKEFDVSFLETKTLILFSLITGFIFGFFSSFLFAFTLVEVHVLLPSYVDKFLKMDGNIYASAEIYYSFGAIMAGLLILRMFRKFNAVFGIIVLMIVVSFAFYTMAIYNILWVFFLGNFILGITNAGVRILKTTYLFNHVPNNLIGRTNSVFGFLNTIVRMLLIGILITIEIIKELPITLIMRPFNFETFATTAYVYASQDLLEAAAAPSLFLILIASFFIIITSRYILKD